MYLQEILEVAIGLIFMWLVLSIASMQLQEWVANIFRWRANDLKGAIYRLLSEPSTAEEFYNHPLIKSLSKKPSEKQDEVSKKSGRRGEMAKLRIPKPSYIPANKFAQALFDIIMTAGTETSVIQSSLITVKKELDLIENKKKREAAKETLSALLELAKKAAHTEGGASTLVKLKNELFKFTKDYPELKSTIEHFFSIPESTASTDKLMVQLRRGITVIGLSNPELRHSLDSLLLGIEGFVTEKETAIAVARKNIESWFNDAMDRLSGYYKRKAQLVAFFLGLFMAILMNVDSIAIATNLWREPTIRQALVAKAEDFQLVAADPANPAQSIRDFRNQFEGLNIPIGWTFETVTVSSGQKCDFFPSSANEIFGVSIQGTCYKPMTASLSTNGWIWMLTKIGGITMSGLAAAQGAPFWFDILKKLINVRGTGSKPDAKD